MYAHEFEDHKYYLTDFCDGYPHDQTSCGEYCDDYKYFTADRQRFGCNGFLTVCRISTLACIRAKVRLKKMLDVI